MTLPVSRHAAITSLALAIAAPSAFADSGAQTTLAPVIVTATRTPQAARDVLSDYLLIGPEEIARSGAGSVTDLLQRQRGIEVKTNGGPGTASSVYIRGANDKQNIVLIDGVRIGSSTTGEANWSAIPLSAIDHIEIVYGPLSTLYGADALGGVIQIFTKKGAGAPRLSASVGAGSDATRAYDAGVAGSTGGEHNFSYAFSAGKEKSDGFSALKPGASKYNPDNDGYDKESAIGQFALQLAKGHEVGMLFLDSKLDAQYDNGRPAVPFDARNLKKLENVAVFSRNVFLPNWNSQFQAAEARDKVENLASRTDQSRISTLQTDITWQNDIMIGADMLQILFDHRKEEVMSSSSRALTRDRITKSVAASYSLKRDRHLASISVRDDDSSQYGSQVTGALGYGYRITKALRASASAGTSFRAPTFNELYFQNFGVATNRPEKGRNAEAGLYFDDAKTQLSMVYYRNRMEDLLINIPKTDSAKYCPPGYTLGCARNISAAILEGVSLSGRRQFGDFHVSANVDLQDPRDESSGKLLIRRSKKHANFALEYGTGAFKGGAELQLSGKRFEDVANNDKLGGYGLLNLYTTYQVAPDWSLLARWNNATNKQYETAKTYATGGATVFVGLRYGMR
jgi:vitamin B12 transporter